jgi:hypothetical protein
MPIDKPLNQQQPCDSETMHASEPSHVQLPRNTSGISQHLQIWWTVVNTLSLTTTPLLLFATPFSFA